MKKILFFLLFFNTLSGFAQKSVGLFLHPDKTIYLKNETVWFSAYLLDTSKNSNQHRLLNVLISSADNGKIIIEEKFPMNLGISMGKIILPDSIKAGVFKLIAFTDVLDTNLKPKAFFMTTLTIGQHDGSTTNTTVVNPAIQQIENLPVVKAQLLTDKNVYGKREKVALKIKLPTQGLFSVAAVYHTRLNDDQPKIMNTVIDNSFENTSGYQQQPLILTVKRKNKPLDKSVNVVLFGNSQLNILSTDKSGRVELDRDALLIPYGKKIAAMISGERASDFQIELQNPMDEAGKLLAKANIMSAFELISRQNNQPTLQKLTETIALNTVTIKGNAKGSSVSHGKPGINDCGDWVDEYDYLNYPYSEKRFNPIIGKHYKKRTDLDPSMRSFKVEPIYYTGCEFVAQQTSTLFKGINLESQFYSLDYSSQNAQYLTTLFWGAGLLSNTNGEADLTFATADLTGEYRIVLQGITAKGVCCGEIVFVVK